MLGLVAGRADPARARSAHAPRPGAAPGSSLLVVVHSELYPAFAPRVPDYVVLGAVAGLAVQVITAARGQAVAIDGHRARGGSFQAAVSLSSGQAFPFAVTIDGVCWNHQRPLSV